MCARIHTRRLADSVMRRVFTGIAMTTVVLLVGIFVFLLFNASGALRAISLDELLLSGNWNPSAYGEPTWGIAGLVMGTLLISIGAMCVAVPLGLSLAIYLSEIASPRMRELLKPAVEMIAGIPSVVLGLLGLLYLAPLVSGVFRISNGLNALTASILVGIASVPTIASLSEDSLASLSVRLREASLAMGATRWTTIRKVLLPASASGIAAAIMLGLGRAIGETVIVLMVAGNSLAFPTSYLSPVRPMTATIAIEIREVVAGDVHWGALFLIGLLLFILTFAINVATDVLLRRRVT